MPESARAEFDTIHIGDPVVLACRALLVVASAALLWEAVGIVPRLVVPSVRPSESVISDCVGLALFVIGWVLVAALTATISRRRGHRGSV